MKQKIPAYLFVFIQFSMLIFLLRSAPVLSSSHTGILVEMTGVIIGLMAIFQMQLGNFNIAPLPKQGGKLVTSGLYQYIRHPMYLAQLMAMLPLVVDYYSHYRLAAWMILLVNLIGKLHFEEGLLVSQYPDYKQYKKNSWRLIPFVF